MQRKQDVRTGSCSLTSRSGPKTRRRLVLGDAATMAAAPLKAKKGTRHTVCSNHGLFRGFLSEYGASYLGYLRGTITLGSGLGSWRVVFRAARWFLRRGSRPQLASALNHGPFLVQGLDGFRAPKYKAPDRTEFGAAPLRKKRTMILRNQRTVAEDLYAVHCTPDTTPL